MTHAQDEAAGKAMLDPLIAALDAIPLPVCATCGKALCSHTDAEFKGAAHQKGFSE
ncbi:hypothetical protein [Sphingomonas echinoides]|uniref:hypothetical protein n=1 Tax=Sphingomonas echinoides TaxID=59803 RepID=UPI0024132EC6|nr:hypothetical protein [Sphingomonas echinoides]